MIELVRRVVREEPDRLALVTGRATLDYADLLAAALRVAAVLRADGITRFAVADFEADVVLPCLLGASATGAEACILPPDDAATVADLVARFGHEVVLTDRTDLDLPATRLVPTSAWLTPELQAADAELQAVDAELQAVDAARPHLVLTTGTTGKPRGVRQDWARLVRSTARVADGRGERWLLAYGLHQFAGLQILLHTMAAGATLVAPAPRRPREGLAAMRTYDVTHASATPTYWRFLLAELRSDGGPVPALQQITLGGEAAPGPVLDQLRATFATANLSHVYAASEFGATGSTRDGRPGLPIEVLERGDDADIAMKVVDGELWVRSRIGMLGYHGEPEVDPDTWRATGDLVEVVDGRILFRGRASEIINVGGVKVHPLPIEETVAAVPGVAVARVFGRPNAMTGAIVAVEVVPEPDADPDAVKAAVRDACAGLPAAARPRSVRIVDAVQTAGDKIVRRTGEQ